MSANSWRLAACGAILVAVGAACSVTTTVPSVALDGGPGSGGDGGGANGEAAAHPTQHSGGVVDTPDTGTGGTGDASSCSIPMVFQKAACQTCMNAKCCVEVNTCVGDPACVKLNNCLVGCQADGGGPPDDAGVTPCQKMCAAAAPQKAIDEFRGIGACLNGSCKTECM